MHKPQIEETEIETKYRNMPSHHYSAEPRTEGPTSAHHAGWRWVRANTGRRHK